MIEDIEPLVGEFDRDLEYVLPDVCVTDDELAAALEPKADKTDIPTKASQLENDCDYTTNLYVNAKFEEAIKAGFKTEVVETLPTENISHQIIYLVPSEEAKEQNIYDEYVYTVNNEWEKIGTTGIDLSQYATIKYVDDAVANAGGGSTGPIVMPTDTEGQKAVFQQIFDNYIENKTILDVQMPKIVSGFEYILTLTSVYYVQAGNRLYCSFTTNFIRSNDYTYDSILTSEYYCEVENNVITSVVNSVSPNIRIGKIARVYAGSNTNNLGALLVDNSTAYTPTGDYNPATKKYVDDAVANAGSSEPIYVYSINKYIYGNTVSTLDTDDVAGLQSVISKFLNGEENKAILSLIIRGADACLTTIDGEVVDLVLDKTKFENSGIISLYSKTIPRSTKFQKYELRLNITMEEGFILNTAIIYNTTSNIITQSIMDNAIAEALGDVNTILATLTTVEEGE